MSYDPSHREAAPPGALAEATPPEAWQAYRDDDAYQDEPQADWDQGSYRATARLAPEPAAYQGASAVRRRSGTGTRRRGQPFAETGGGYAGAPGDYAETGDGYAAPRTATRGYPAPGTATRRPQLATATLTAAMPGASDGYADRPGGYAGYDSYVPRTGGYDQHGYGYDDAGAGYDGAAAGYREPQDGFDGARVGHYGPATGYADLKTPTQAHATATRTRQAATG